MRKNPQCFLPAPLAWVILGPNEWQKLGMSEKMQSYRRQKGTKMGWGPGGQEPAAGSLPQAAEMQRPRRFSTASVWAQCCLVQLQLITSTPQTQMSSGSPTVLKDDITCRSKWEKPEFSAAKQLAQCHTRDRRKAPGKPAGNFPPSHLCHALC